MDLRIVGQDGTAPTMLLRDAADLDTFAFLDDSQAGAAYVAFAARGGEAPRVLVIGAGGGIDVMIALAHGAPFVTAVEINRAMIDMVADHFDGYLGGLFRRGGHPLAERIDLVHGEGRAFVRQSPERYDVIQLSGVDSFTALNTGAYTLSESYLYTTEAIHDFYEHLGRRRLPPLLALYHEAAQEAQRDAASGPCRLCRSTGAGHRRSRLPHCGLPGLRLGLHLDQARPLHAYRARRPGGVRPLGGFSGPGVRPARRAG